MSKSNYSFSHKNKKYNNKSHKKIIKGGDNSKRIEEAYKLIDNINKKLSTSFNNIKDNVSRRINDDTKKKLNDKLKNKLKNKINDFYDFYEKLNLTEKKDKTIKKFLHKLEELKTYLNSKH